MHLGHSFTLVIWIFYRNVITGYPQYKVNHPNYHGAALYHKYQSVPSNH